jgi:hypothetical protein
MAGNPSKQPFVERFDPKADFCLNLANGGLVRTQTIQPAKML